MASRESSIRSIGGGASGAKGSLTSTSVQQSNGGDEVLSVGLPCSERVTDDGALCDSWVRVQTLNVSEAFVDFTKSKRLEKRTDTVVEPKGFCGELGTTTVVLPLFW